MSFGETKNSRCIGDYVVYRKSGVCRISDITSQNFGHQGKKDYYVLESVYENSSKIFVPIGSPLDECMTEIPSVDEINLAIEKSKTIDFLWEHNGKKRALVFEKTVNEGTKEDLIRMCTEIKKYRAKLEKTKSHLKSNDIKYLSLGERMIAGEFAFVLGIPKSEVASYIEKQINK